MVFKQRLILHLIAVPVIILGTLLGVAGYFASANTHLRERAKFLEKQFAKTSIALTDARKASADLEIKLKRALDSARRVEEEAGNLRESNRELRERLNGLEESIRDILTSFDGIDGSLGEVANVIRDSLRIVQSIQNRSK